MSQVTIIIPLYNKEKYISRTLHSVLSQSYTDFECIIVDSSDDGSTEIVSHYSDPRIKHMIQRERTYLPIARNIGIKHAQSDLIAFIDADDEWTPDHLKSLVHLYDTYPDAGIYATPYIKLQSNSKPMTMVFAGIPKPPWEGLISRYFYYCSIGDVPISSSSCAIRKEILQKMGGFSEELIHGGEDQHLWARIALYYSVAFTWKGIAIYHTEASGRMCNEPRKRVQDPLSLYLFYLMTNDKIHPELIPDVQAYIRKRERMFAFSHFLSGNQHKKPQKPIAHEPIISHSSLVKKTVKSIFATILINIYNSHIHNTSRKIRCAIYGWHIPSIED